MKDLSLSIKDEKNNLITKVLMSRNRMLLLSIENDVAKCLKACCNDTLWLWYLQFRHLYFLDLSLTAKQNMVRGISYINHQYQLCE